MCVCMCVCMCERECVLEDKASTRNYKWFSLLSKVFWKPIVGIPRMWRIHFILETPGNRLCFCIEVLWTGWNRWCASRNFQKSGLDFQKVALLAHFKSTNMADLFKVYCAYHWSTARRWYGHWKKKTCTFVVTIKYYTPKSLRKQNKTKQNKKIVF